MHIGIAASDSNSLNGRKRHLHTMGMKLNNTTINNFQQSLITFGGVITFMGSKKYPVCVYCHMHVDMYSNI